VKRFPNPHSRNRGGRGEKEKKGGEETCSTSLSLSRREKEEGTTRVSTYSSYVFFDVGEEEEKEKRKGGSPS